jgi:hypothetical protein
MSEIHVKVHRDFGDRSSLIHVISQFCEFVPFEFSTVFLLGRPKSIVIDRACGRMAVENAVLSAEEEIDHKETNCEPIGGNLARAAQQSGFL